MSKREVLELSQILAMQRKFVRDRDWEKFHTPKNIAMALGIEAAELAEVFLWLTDLESKGVMRKPRAAKKVREEIADVFYWLVRLADILEIDLEDCFYKKMGKNRRHYPIKLAKGRAHKYTEL